MDHFNRDFKQLKSGEAAKDQHLLLTTILASAIKLGLSKMAESCPSTTYARSGARIILEVETTPHPGKCLGNRLPPMALPASHGRSFAFTPLLPSSIKSR